MNTRFKTVLRWLFLFMIIASCLYFSFYFIQYGLDEKRSEKEQENVSASDDGINTIINIYNEQLEKTSEKKELSPEVIAMLQKLDGYHLLNIDHESLFEENGDYIGWIDIPDTAISYPVYKCESNFDYLHADAKHNYLYAGCIYRDANTEESSQNIVFHGHNMRSGTMFAGLNKYIREGEEYLDEHSLILFYPRGEDPQVYAVYSIYTLSGSKADNVSYTPSFRTVDDYREFIEAAKENSVYDIAYRPETDALTLTLSTCTGSSRANMRCILHTGRIL